jgi:hypothetical protein
VEDGVFLPLWYLWRERNDSYFENHERTVVSLCFSIPSYLWIIASVFPNVLSLHDFLIFFLLLGMCFFLYTSYAPVCILIFNDISLFVKKTWFFN